ncbi:MAG: DUF3320 domain-containing protein [Chloroflexi bacterium]|nr:DUF3320 domain-containing protein [Chloroflexota bacterium]
MQQAPVAKLEAWRSRLLDLTRRNRLLFFKPTRQSIQVTAPTPADLLRLLVAQERTLDFPVVVDETDMVLSDESVVPAASASFGPPAPAETRPSGPSLRPGQVQTALAAKDLARVLYKVRLQSQSTIAEQGVNTLFLALGMLEWREADTSKETVRAPLVLVPVKVEQDSMSQVYRLSFADDEVVVNPTLAYKLRGDFGLTLPELGDAIEDVSLGSWFDQARRVVRKHGWSVADEAWIGQFSFLKLSMYRDLEAHRAEVVQHPVAGALAGARALPPPERDAPRADELDQKLDPSDCFPVLDADSSQLEAVARSRAGQHLVIDGPPGTGKSQTIANIIADQLASGKKVLFVSEKMAALEVVYERLKAAGLGTFCLEAHSHHASKRDVIGQLGSALLGQDLVSSGYRVEEKYHELRRDRDRLNSYVHALHRERDRQGRTAFEVHGALAALRTLPEVPFDLPLSGVLGMPAADDERLHAVVRRIAAGPELLTGYRSHPWRGSAITTFSLALQQDLQAQFRSVTTLLDEVIAVLPRLSGPSGLDTPSTLDEAEWLLGTTRLVIDSPLPPTDWFVRNSLQPLLESARSYKERFDHWHAERDDLLRCYTPKLFDLNCTRLAERLGPAHGATLLRINRNLSAATTAAVFHRHTLEHALAQAQELLVALPHELAGLSAACGLPAPATLSEADTLVQTGMLVGLDPRPTPSWLQWEMLTGLHQEAEEAARRQAARDQARAALDAAFKVGVYDLPGGDWLRRFTEDYRGMFARMKGDYKRDRAALQELLRQPEKLEYDEAVTHLRRLADYQGMAEQAEQRRGALAASFGMHLQGDDTDWQQVQESLGTVRRLLTLHGGHVPSPSIERALLQSGAAIRAVRARAETASAQLAELRDLIARLQTVVSLAGLTPGSPVLEDAPLEAIAPALVLLGDDLRSVWTAHDAVLRTLQPGVMRAAADVIADTQRAAAVQALQAEVTAHREQLTETYGAYFDDMNTEWDEVIDALGWTGAVKSRFGNSTPPFGFIRAVCHGSDVPALIRDDHARLTMLLDRLPAERAALHRYFPAETLLISGQPFGRAVLTTLSAWLRARLDGVGRLQEWVDFLDLQAACDSHGLAGFLQAVLERGVSAEQVEGQFERAFLTRWLDEAYRSDPELSGFRREEHEYLARHFRILDTSLRTATAGKIAKGLAAKRPRLAASANPVEQSETGILLREARKKTRHMPLRKLFAQIPHLLLDLKPCLLMSPLSVAYYLPKGSFAFDVVIFDEASQIAPQDAIGAMLRAKQVIVAGDDRQLPPTAFFTAEERPDEDDEDGANDPLESVLDECAALPAMQRAPLRWHYRSRHESLIAFSNAAFYDNKLITFPGPEQAGDRAGVRFVHVPDGVWDRGKSRTNVQEARRTADLVFEHFQEWGGKRSLGVITLNQAQADRIHDELRTRRRERRDFEEFFAEEGAEPFFIKSLENVQGDERDAIILCIGYGPDQNGVVALNFGPINREGGERRLNVAVTRAKRQLTLVTSMHPHQMELARLNRPNRGVKVLQDYLYYARDGKLPVESTPLDREPASPFEEAVRDALRAKGLEVDTQVGCSGFRIDLAVRHPDRMGSYILGVECDGATYHSARTARDRDRLRQEVLEGLGWNIHRIWSTDWVRDPSGETTRVLEAVERLRTGLVPEAPSIPVDETLVLIEQPEAVVEAPALTGPPEWAVRPEAVYRPFEPATRYASQRLYEARPEWLAKDILSVVEAEGPVHEGVLMQRVARMYDINRIGANVRTAIESGLVAAVKGGSVRRQGEFFWPAAMTAVTPRRTAPGETARPAEHIAPEEIRAAAEIIIAENYHMPRPTLVEETARWLGFQRLGGKVVAAIDVALAPMFEQSARAG